MKNKCIAVVAALFAAGLSQLAMASEIIVSDCDGAVRASQQIDEGSSAKVLVNVVNPDGLPASGTTLALSRDGAEQIELQTSDAGVATFEEVSAGLWTACPNDSGPVLKHVLIVAPTVPTGNTTTNAGLWMGGLAAGGGVLGILAGSGGSGSDSNQQALSGIGPNLAGVQDDVFLSPGGPSDQISNSRRPIQQAAEDCLTDQEPDPISPIS